MFCHKHRKDFQMPYDNRWRYPDYIHGNQELLCPCCGWSLDSMSSTGMFCDCDVKDPE